MKKWMLAVAIVAAGFAAFPVYAEEKEGDEDKAAMAQKHGEMAGHMALAVAMRLSDVLKLDDAATLKLYHTIRKHQEDQRAIGEKAKQAQSDLKEALEKDEKNDAKLKELMGKLLAAREANRAAEDKLMEDLKAQLTVQQQARLMVAFPQIRKQIQGMARMAMMARRMGQMRQMMDRMKKTHEGTGGGAMGPHPGQGMAMGDMDEDEDSVD